MWVQIVAAILVLEALGGLFFYSMTRVGDRADERLGALRRGRIQDRRRQVGARRPSNA